MDSEYLATFFAEQEDRMNMPDEDMETYASRLRDLDRSPYVSINALDPGSSVLRTSVACATDAAADHAPHMSDGTGDFFAVSVPRREKRTSPDHLNEGSRKKSRYADDVNRPKAGFLATNGPQDAPDNINTSSQGPHVGDQCTSFAARVERPGTRKPDVANMPPPPVPSTSQRPPSRPLALEGSNKGTAAMNRIFRTYSTDASSMRAEVMGEKTGPTKVGPSNEQALPTPRTSPIGSPHPERALSLENPVAEQGNRAGKPRSAGGTPEPKSKEDPDSSNVTTPGTSSLLASAAAVANGNVGAEYKSEPPKRKKLSFLRQGASDAYLREMERLKNAPPPVKKPAKKSKKKQEAMRPAEFAKYVSSLWTEAELRKRPEKELFLRGMKIFYCDTDNALATPITRQRLEYLARHGATLVPTYDPASLTHVVTNVYKALFLKKVGLQGIRGVPDTVPILRWEWILSGERMDCLGRWHEYPTYDDHVVFEPDIPQNERERILAEREAKKLAAVKGKEKAAKKPDDDESDKDANESRISEFTQEHLRKTAGSTLHAASGAAAPPVISTGRSSRETRNDKAQKNKNVTTNISASTSAATSHGGDDKADPLAEFYSVARAEREAELRKEKDVSATAVGSKKTGAFQCDNVPDGKKKICPNQDIIDALDQLKRAHKIKLTKADTFKAANYARAIGSLTGYKKRIESYEEAFALPGVGSKTAEKIMEFIETGRIRRLEYEATEEVVIIEKFQGIYGVGITTAHKWMAAGCRTLDDLREGKHGVKLSTAQQIGLQYYDDINTRMPRKEAQAIFDLIKPIALSIDSRLFVEIMGSYRRGKADCGDIDILITRSTEDGKSHAGVLRKLIKELHRREIITEDLSAPEDWDDLENVYRGLCRRDTKSPRRRIDFLTVPYKSRGAALLYYTGDDIFNRSMRLKANKMGYSLNQRGLYANVIRNPSDRRQKLDDGIIIASETEQEIFEKLGVPWQEPHQRVRGA